MSIRLLKLEDEWSIYCSQYFVGFELIELHGSSPSDALSFRPVKKWELLNCFITLRQKVHCPSFELLKKLLDAWFLYVTMSRDKKAFRTFCGAELQ